MRKTTQRLLLMLYAEKERDLPRLRLDWLAWLLPELTLAGIRSLVYYLNSQGLIEVIELDGISWLSITQLGKKQLRVDFKALDPFWDMWEGEWEKVVFLASSKGDKQFRYLRNLLVTEGALPLSRGVYLWPKGLLAKVESTIISLYQHSVLVVDFKKTTVGDLRPIVNKYYELNSLYNQYSSISREMNSLLQQVEVKKSLIRKDREKFLNLIEKIRFNLELDLGLTKYYFPDLTRVEEIIKQLQLIVKYL